MDWVQIIKSVQELNAPYGDASNINNNQARPPHLKGPSKLITLDGSSRTKQPLYNGGTYHSLEGTKYSGKLTRSFHLFDIFSCLSHFPNTDRWKNKCCINIDSIITIFKYIYSYNIYILALKGPGFLEPSLHFQKYDSPISCSVC